MALKNIILILFLTVLFLVSCASKMFNLIE